MHIHLGGFDFLTTALYVIVFAYIWRSVANYFADTTFGQAMAYIL